VVAGVRSLLGHRGDPAEDWRKRLSMAAARLRADIFFAITDAFLISVAYVAALQLRLFDSGITAHEDYWTGLFKWLPLIIAIHLAANVLFGAYGHVWEYASIAEGVQVLLATAASGFILVASIYGYRALGPPGTQGPFPVPVVVVGSIITLLGMGAVRFRSRMFSIKRLAVSGRRRILIVGSGTMAAHFIRSTASIDDPPTVLGLVTIGGHHPKKMIAGVRVLGELANLPSLINEHKADEVLVITSSDHVARRVVDLCLENDVRLRIVPDVGMVMRTEVGALDVRDLEIQDLLPRAQVTIDRAAVIGVVAGRRVLVTGAGGSIGSEIVRQVLEVGPSELMVLDHDETHLHEARFRWVPGDARLRMGLADIRDKAGLGRLFDEFRPEVVFHAAAHKHVPILEETPEEAIKTNIIGTANVLAASRQARVGRFIAISTDKAVNPTSVMGASKRVAEMLVQAATVADKSCRYASVRFGNVLGSRGSVVPTFTRQIRAGGPVTITDLEMTRYFMTTDEAVELVLQASALAESGEIFVLDMGSPVRIVDLAHRLIRLSGLVPGRDIQVQVIGARPGERLSEVLSSSPLEAGTHPKIFLARESFPGPVTLLDAVDTLELLAHNGEKEAARDMLYNLVRGHWNVFDTVDLRGVSDNVSSWS
jgi:FlaA1/EpsC-like NDP-sugar epimerase